MSNQEETELLLLEMVVALSEKVKLNDESIQKAIEILEREQTDLELFRNSIASVANRVVTDELRNALKTQNSALETYFHRIDSVTDKLYAVKHELNWRNGLWYFGGYAVFMAMVAAFIWWFVPSLDEIRSRTRQVELLNTQIERSENLNRLQVSYCGKQTCVKVIETQCNYGKKGDRYCVADLK